MHIACIAASMLVYNCACHTALNALRQGLGSALVAFREPGLQGGGGQWLVTL
jgi:hypothetical protein